MPKIAEVVRKDTMLTQHCLRDFQRLDKNFRNWGAKMEKELAAGGRFRCGPLKLDRKALQAMLALPPLVSGKWKD